MSIMKKEQDANQSYVNQRRMLLNSHTPFHIQEAYRTLQTNLRFSLPGEEVDTFWILLRRKRGWLLQPLILQFVHQGHCI